MNVLLSGAVAFTRFSLLPWCLLDLYGRNTEYHYSWGAAVCSYGVLLTVFQLGSVVGTVLAETILRFPCFQSSRDRDNEHNHSSHERIIISSPVPALAFLFHCSSYVLLCFVNRYIAYVGLFFSLGATGSLIVAYTTMDRVPFNTDPLSGMIIPKKHADFERSNNTKRLFVTFIFTTLVSGYLYDGRADAHSAKFYLAILFILCCSIIGGYGLFVSTIISNGRRWKASNSKNNSKSSGSDR
jgi:hypothetical protein